MTNFESDRKLTFVDRVGWSPARDDLWPSVVIPREQIEQEAARLAALTRPANGRRRSLIVHPRSEEPGLGLAPGITVSLDVLLPGESTAPIRHNSSQVNFCISGAGHARIDGVGIDYERHDVFNTPSMATYVHTNNTDAVSVRLTYSNAALLEKLNVHYVQEDPTDELAVSATDDKTERAEAKEALFDDYFELTEAGAWLMSYEKLVNPPLKESKPLHWPWQMVQEEIDKLTALGSAYKGRRLYLLYNPASGRTNGTTHSFFATMCVRPAHIVRHPAPTHGRRHQLLLRRLWVQRRGREDSRMEGGRLDAVRTRLGRTSPCQPRQSGLRADHPGQPAAPSDGFAALAGRTSARSRSCWAHTGASTPTASN